MPDSREWLTKQLTEESQYTSAQSHKKKDGPTSQQKRKHQITYLAFQVICIVTTNSIICVALFSSGCYIFVYFITL